MKNIARRIKQLFSSPCSIIVIVVLLFAPNLTTFANSGELPSLGDSASGTVSPEKEHRLGRAWLRALRSRTPIMSDPLVHDYVEYLLYRLAEHSQLQDRRLELVIIKSPALNAFAVPGGIVGVNAGLFINAQTEQEFSSVIAHELAHLSQRHYSRNVDEARRKQIPSMAALLASVVIAATVGGDAGIAAMTATQAALLQGQLRFSRQNEQEADRIGLLTMVNAGMDPQAMASMFERMLATQRLLGSRPPEFLLTHPVTESRVADARSRASQFPKGEYQDQIEYYLMRNRILLTFESTVGYTIKQFEAELDNPKPTIAKAARYGLALAYKKSHQEDKANAMLAPLLAEEPNRISYLIAFAEINQASNKLKEVETLLKKNLGLSPNNHSLSLYLAKNLNLQQRYQESEAILLELSKERPNDPNVWYELAEIHGLSGNILGVHQARAEYFILTGNMDRATEQLDFARIKAGGNYQLSAKINQRLKDVQNYREELKNF